MLITINSFVLLCNMDELCTSGNMKLDLPLKRSSLRISKTLRMSSEAETSQRSTEVICLIGGILKISGKEHLRRALGAEYITTYVVEHPLCEIQSTYLVTLHLKCYLCRNCCSWWRLCLSLCVRGKLEYFVSFFLYSRSLFIFYLDHLIIRYSFDEPGLKISLDGR